METEKARVTTAKKLARKLIKECGISHPPVLLNDVIKKLRENYSLGVYKADLGDELSGMMVTTQGDFLDDRTDNILYNQNHHVRRQRFTVAHEVGHLLMGTTHSGAAESFEDSSEHEKEANCFASELLIPTDWLKEDLQKGGKVDELAWKYYVSKDTMGWKISNSNLLKYVKL